MIIRLLLYNILLLLLGVITFPWLLYQLAFVKKRRQGLAQRFGHAPLMGIKTLWCHAVSVGEVRAIGPMLSLLQEDARTRDRIVLSTVTPTGQATANRECGFVKGIFYFPLDLPFVVHRAVRRVNPEMFLTAETEIWPNLFGACFRRGVPVIVVNGRISDGSFPGYMRFRWFFRPFLQRVSHFLMQSEEDARRIREMGARPETVEVTGNMKYDRTAEPVSLPEEVAKWSGSGFLLVAGSTHSGEEEAVLEAVRALEGGKILVALVPRHPERFDEVAALLEKRGEVFTRFADILKGHAVIGDILLVDAMGVLEGFYALADAAFVGGSLVPVGGHNLLEPAMHGVPVLTGPHLHNFRDIADALVSAGACIIVDDGKALTGSLAMLRSDPGRRKVMEEAAGVSSGAAVGASRRNLELILSGDREYGGGTAAQDPDQDHLGREKANRPGQAEKGC